MLRFLAIALALVSSNLFAEDLIKALPHNKTQSGETYQIDTKTCYFRIRILDPDKGEIRIQQYNDGVASTPKNAFLLGASHGQHNGITLVLKNEIRVGMNLEIGYGSTTAYERNISDEVTKIEKIERSDLKENGSTK